MSAEFVAPSLPGEEVLPPIILLSAEAASDVIEHLLLMAKHLLAEEMMIGLGWQEEEAAGLQILDDKVNAFAAPPR